MEGKNLRSNSGAVNKMSLPFYEPPQRKTSADIINEARAAIRGKLVSFLISSSHCPNFSVDSRVLDNSYASTSIKPLQTQRPFTPKERERILFGKKAKSDRPPSSFRYVQF